MNHDDLFEEYRKYRESIQHDITKTGSLFSDPYLQNMKKRLDPETRAYYEQIGEQMYGYDYVTNGQQFDLKQRAEKIIKVLKLGLEPEDLKEEEKKTLQEFLGDDWKTKYEDYTIEN